MTLLWQRALGDPDFKRIFCLVHAERLTYQVSDMALRSLSDVSQGKTGWLMNIISVFVNATTTPSVPGYRLVIICSNEEEEKSHIISKLHNCRRPFALTLDTEQCQRYLTSHFTGQIESFNSSQNPPAMASNIDHEKLATNVHSF